MHNTVGNANFKLISSPDEREWTHTTACILEVSNFTEVMFGKCSNRRDVWTGTDLQGVGKMRADWNEHLLQVQYPFYRYCTPSIQSR